jgi:valyl-tRNA synthetase
MLAIEDTMVRFARMNGKRVLWIPGTDSAAIATQSTVEKAIQKSEKKSRHDLGREELLKRIDIFVDQNKNTMLSQMRAMGASLDWSRYAYTMDETRYKAVMEAFVRMYQAGLIYRGNRIVNWDPKGQTTISDDEIVHEERESKMYTFKYSKDFPITISTTRPETKVGDTAVAVHPDDTRYSKYIGETYNIIFCDVAITVKIIADTAVEKDFGTGALGVTPAHSQIDWEIADRHDLPRPQVINEYAKMTVDGRLKDKKTTEARELVVEWLKEQNLLEKEEVVTQNISTAERTGGIVEPLPKLQWFIDVNKDFTIPYSEITGIETGSKTTLKKIMLAAVEHGQTSFVSKQYEKVYFSFECFEYT